MSVFKSGFYNENVLTNGSRLWANISIFGSHLAGLTLVINIIIIINFITLKYNFNILRFHENFNKLRLVIS